jgi:RNA polymerase sigma-70 factor (ECF subfamily)
MSMTPVNDPERRLEVELLSRMATGDTEAFASFYRRSSNGLYAFALKMMNDPGDAEDVLQDAYSYMWRKAFSYDAARSSPFTWAVMIVRNKAIDRLRSRQRQTRIVEKATSEHLHFDDADDVSAEEPARRERCAQVRAALAEISSDQKQAVEMAFFGGLTHEQIAEQLGAPLGTVKARIRRGLLKLRDCLKGAS